MEIINLLKKPAGNTEQKILKVFLIVVLPVMAILTTVAIIDYHESKNGIIAKMIRAESANANKRITNFLDPITRNILFFQYQGNRGKLDPEKPTEIQEFLNDFKNFYLRNVKQVLFFDGADTSIYQLKSADNRKPTKHSGSLYELDKSLTEKDNGNQINWISGDYDPNNGESTLLAETFFRHPGTKKPYSFALHIETTDFFKGLKKYIIGPQKLLLLRSTNKELRMVLFDYAEDGKPEIKEIDQKDSPEMEAAIAIWRNDKTKAISTFTYQGKIWWASFLKLQIKNRDSYSALLVPESAVMTVIRKGRFSLPIYSSIVMAIALIATIFLWRRYVHEMKLASLPPLLTEMDDGSLRETINAGEEDLLEFKSTLRWNLKANRQGKEIEMSCMKTIVAFLNSNGGSLIIGVEDNGNILGTKADNFPNDDKLLLHFNNLIKQHIGLAFSKFILFKTRQLEDKTILIVDCRKSDKPVFLKKAEDEEFYIRVGPGSRKLTFSETMDYLKKKNSS